uniref:Uncharacterized protein n=1 Tax=Populus trichocarpa TaxID=3694 RepID=A0A2K1YZI3_POPTR
MNSMDKKKQNSQIIRSSRFSITSVTTPATIRGENLLIMSSLARLPLILASSTLVITFLVKSCSLSIEVSAQRCPSNGPSIT